LKVVHAVHTTGVNWQSVGVIVALLGVLVAVLLWYFDRREKVRADESEILRREITGAVNHLSTVLLAKLETKETVSRISERLSRVEAVIGASKP
jgi:hypothetical protein